MKLTIGRGKYGRFGWTTLDADPNIGAHIVAKVPPLPPEANRDWEEIEMIHFLEHLYQWEAAELLENIHQVMRPGARLVIELPDLSFAAEVLAGVRERIPGTVNGQCDMWPIYGNPAERNPLFNHKWGYTPVTLRRALETAGFDASRIEQNTAQYHVPGRDFRMEAVR